MAQVSFTIPNAKLPDWIEAWGSGYQETLEDGSPNPVTKPQYAKRQFINIGIDRVKKWKKQKAANATTWDDTGIE